jgi:hypothetical protein
MAHKNHVFYVNIILWHVHPLLGKDREISDYKTAVTRQRLLRNHVYINIILWHVHPLLGKDREISDYKTTVTRQRRLKNVSSVRSVQDT